MSPMFALVLTVVISAALISVVLSCIVTLGVNS